MDVLADNQAQANAAADNQNNNSDYMGLALKQWSVYLGNVLLNFIHKECKNGHMCSTNSGPSTQNMQQHHHQQAPSLSPIFSQQQHQQNNHQFYKHNYCPCCHYNYQQQHHHHHHNGGYYNYAQFLGSQRQYVSKILE